MHNVFFIAKTAKQKSPIKIMLNLFLKYIFYNNFEQKNAIIIKYDVSVLTLIINIIYDYNMIII